MKISENRIREMIEESIKKNINEAYFGEAFNVPEIDESIAAVKELWHAFVNIEEKEPNNRALQYLSNILEEKLVLIKSNLVKLGKQTRGYK